MLISSGCTMVIHSCASIAWDLSSIAIVLGECVAFVLIFLLLSGCVVSSSRPVVIGGAVSLWFCIVVTVIIFTFVIWLVCSVAFGLYTVGFIVFIVVAIVMYVSFVVVVVVVVVVGDMGVIVMGMVVVVIRMFVGVSVVADRWALHRCFRCFDGVWRRGKR